MSKLFIKIINKKKNLINLYSLNCVPPSPEEEENSPSVILRRGNKRENMQESTLNVNLSSIIQRLGHPFKIGF